MTAKTSEDFTIEVTSVPDRDDLVAEVWLGRELMAELRHESGELRVQLYPDPAGKPWDVPYEAIIRVLEDARRKLGSP